MEAHRIGQLRLTLKPRHANGITRVRVRRSSARVSGRRGTRADAAAAGEVQLPEGMGKAEATGAVRYPPRMAVATQLGGSATLEKSGLDLSQAPQPVEPKTDDSGGGGDDGNKISFGGGGDDDDDDDDDYSGEGDEDDDGDENRSFMRRVLPELFDRASIEAVLREWSKTLQDLPAGLRMAVEMGIVSSLQLARFMTVDSRPTIVRAISRWAPASLSRSFVGRLMADPAFLLKLTLEQVFTLSTVVGYECAHRKGRMKEEWPLALSSAVTASMANLATVWLIAPARTHGAPSGSALQSFLRSLPNNAFDNEGPLRKFSMPMRAGSVLVKAAELSAVGVLTGGINSGVQSGICHMKQRNNSRFRPSLPVPSPTHASLSMGAYLGLLTSPRYQALAGLDRVMHNRMSSLTVAMAGTSALRFANIQLGEPLRKRCLGLPTRRPATRPASTKKAKAKARKRRAATRSTYAEQRSRLQEPAPSRARGTITIHGSSGSSKATAERG